jgi:hypothetical protein
MYPNNFSNFDIQVWDFMSKNNVSLHLILYNSEITETPTSVKMHEFLEMRHTKPTVILAICKNHVHFGIAFQGCGFHTDLQEYNKSCILLMKSAVC